MSTETFEQTFNVEAPAQLKVSNMRGTIDVRPGEEGVITVTAVKHGNNGRTQVIIEQDDEGQVIAEARYENSITNWFGLNKPNRVDFTIRVPKACSVKVNCVSSSALIDGLEGDIDANAVSGDLELSNLTGNFLFSSVSGKVTAENLSGPIQMNNVSGKFKATGSQIPTLVGKTVSGNLVIETPLIDGPYEFKSVSGNVALVTPEDAACTVHVKSVSGKAKLNLPVTSRSGPRNKQVIEVAGGGPEVHVKSVSGVLKIGPSNGEHATTEVDFNRPTRKPKKVVEPVEPAAPVKSQMEILQEIENGDLSVEDAIEQLNP
jgi:hypothetical protein